MSRTTHKCREMWKWDHSSDYLYRWNPYFGWCRYVGRNRLDENCKTCLYCHADLEVPTTVNQVTIE